MADLFAILFLLALIIALALFLSARRQRAQTGLPYGARIVYAERGATIPVEVKPNRVAPAPRESDTLQLAAYALLIEENFGAAPAYGLLKYRDAVFQVELTDELRARLLDTLAAMRRDLVARDVPRSHAEPRRCRACGYRAECGQAL